MSFNKIISFDDDEVLFVYSLAAMLICLKSGIDAGTFNGKIVSTSGATLPLLPLLHQSGNDNDIVVGNDACTTALELFESVVNHLSDNNKQRAIDEIKILKTLLENEYQ